MAEHWYMSQSQATFAADRVPLIQDRRRPLVLVSACSFSSPSFVVKRRWVEVRFRLSAVNATSKKATRVDVFGHVKG